MYFHLPDCSGLQLNFKSFVEVYFKITTVYVNGNKIDRIEN